MISIPVHIKDLNKSILNYPRSILILLVVTFVISSSQGQVSVIYRQTENIGPGLSIPSTWGTFWGSMNTHIASQDIIISHIEYQYIAYYNENRHVVLGRRHMCDRDWEFIVFEDYLQTTNDRHNHISIGICPNDGTIHLSFDHHVDTLNYRVSIPDVANHPELYSWEPDLFSSVRDYLIEGRIQTRLTYPAFVQTNDGHLNIIFRYRGSGNAESYIGFYSGTLHKWVDVHKFIDSTGEYQDPYLEYSSSSRNAYPFDYVYDDEGFLHIAWVWRESSQSKYNHDLAYARSPDHGMTWYNNEGEIIGRTTATDTTFIKYASPGLHIWTIDSRYGMINNGGMALDQHNQPHIMCFHRVEPSHLPEPSFVSYGDGRHHHYWRSPNGSWHKQQTWFRGSRPRLYSDLDGNMYMTLIDRVDSLEATSPYIVRVAIAEAATGWSEWYQIYEGVYNTKKNEPPADRIHLKDQGVFSVVSHEFYDFFLNGPMFITDIYTDIEHQSKLQVDITSDAFVVNGNSSGLNYGNWNFLAVADKAGDTIDSKSYVKFDLSKLLDLNVSGILSAELVLNTLNGNSGFTDEEYDLFFVYDDSWDESYITWDNAPENTEFIQTIYGDSSIMRWEITAEVVDELSGDATLSLCIIKRTENSPADIIFHAKESSANGMSPKIIVKAESSCLQDIGLFTAIDDEKSVTEDVSIIVYPNPARTSHITVAGLDNYTGSPIWWQIIDINGRTIKASSIHELKSNSIVINLSGCNSGLYCIRLLSEHHPSESATFILCK